MKVAAVVPSLNPDIEFTTVVEELVAAGFTNIYVVNDGSSSEYAPLFCKAAEFPGCVVLEHEVNHGKGRALKTAFERYLADDTGCIGIVTLDADGQHSIDDVMNIAQVLQQNPDTLVLGARDFSKSNVPAKSALGNKITRGVFSMVCGIPITDTQTGLRGIPNQFIKELMNVSGERYEFETNMLLETKRSRVPVKEIPISTIYLNNNSASHFRPLVDGFRIYFLILKFMLSSLASALVDVVLFALFYNFVFTALPQETSLLAATVAARVLSALFNFFVNKRVVFGSAEPAASAMLRYTFLAIAQMLCSYGGVYLLSAVLPLPTLFAKILVDTALFFVSFFIQRKWVFKTNN